MKQGDLPAFLFLFVVLLVLASTVSCGAGMWLQKQIDYCEDSGYEAVFHPTWTESPILCMDQHFSHPSHDLSDTYGALTRVAAPAGGRVGEAAPGPRGAGGVRGRRHRLRGIRLPVVRLGRVCKPLEGYNNSGVERRGEMTRGSKWSVPVPSPWEPT